MNDCCSACSISNEDWRPTDRPPPPHPVPLIVMLPRHPILLLILSCLIAPAISAQNPDDPPPAPPTNHDLLDDLTAEWSGNPAPVDSQDAELVQAHREFLKAEYAYRIAALDHRRRVFAWQHISERFIFFVVLGVVGCGLWFSWLQFRRSLSAAAPSDGSTDEHSGGGDAPPPSVTELEISVKSVKVSSPVLGVIVLSLSLAFFYLYLVHVYPVKGV